MGIIGGEVFRTGWSRWLPPGLTVLYVKIAQGMPPSSADLDGGLWDEPLDVDDDEQRALDSEARIRLHRLTEKANLEEVRTGADGLELMRRIGLIEMSVGGWKTTDVLPLPEDVVFLTQDEKREEDEYRWTELHYGASQRIIGLFVDADLDALEDSLEGFAKRIECEPNTVREAILVLLGEGDFSTNVDIPSLEVKDRFRLTVDWKKFNESRISIRKASDAEDGDAYGD